MNNFDKIINMNKDELADFLEKLLNGGIEKSHHMIWFDKKYCKVCPDIKVEHNGKKELWKECDFESKCPHQNWGSDLIKLWLESENEEI